MENEVLKPKTNRGVQTRNKLLRSAEYIFGKNGYHQSSITEITQHAGVSLGNFYTYFESKYQIFEELLWDMQEELLRMIKKHTAGIENRIEREREGFKTLFTFLKQRPYWYSLFPQAEFVNKELHRKAMEKFARAYSFRIEESMQRGQIRKMNPEILAYTFMGMTNYVGMKWVIWEEKEITDEMLDEIMSFVKFGIAKQ